MAGIRDHRDLEVWQMAMALAPRVYAIIRKLPNCETYALGDQLRRAVVSVPANIAEGRARQHTGEFLQHVCIARGSLAELDTLLTLAEQLGYANGNEVQPLQAATADLWRALYGLSSSLSRRLRTRA